MEEVKKEVKKEEKDLIIKNITRWCSNYFDFIEECLGPGGLNEKHRYMAKIMTSSRRKSKMILMPRHTFKSSVLTVGYSLYKMVRDPNIRIMVYSDSQAKASGFLTGIKNHLEGKVPSSRFVEAFGDWTTDPHKGKWNDSEILVNKRTVAQIEPTVSTGGIETSQVGRHYDLIIFDDIVTDINTTTKSMMDKVYECYQKSLSLLKPGGEILIVGTRWDFADAYGRIIAENKENDLFDIFISDAEEVAEDGRMAYEGVGLTREFLDEQKRRQGSYNFSCNPYETPILMADLTTKPIGEVKAGDYVVGWKRRKGGKNYLVKSKVLTTNSREAKTVNIEMESGRKIRCTPDHQWYTARLDKTHKEYRPASIGGRLMYVLDPYISDDYDKQVAGWLGGFYDGEGSCAGGSIVFSQSEIVNSLVCRKVEEALSQLGYSYNSDIKQPTRTSLGKETRHYWVTGGKQAKYKFINQCKPAKKDKIIESFFNQSSDFIQEKDKVINIYDAKKEPVYALHTETGNYIAWGYASKNCLYRNNPVDPETAQFKYTDFKFYGALEVSPTPQITGKYDKLYITGTVDPAGEGKDKTAITVVGTDLKMRMFILDIVCDNLLPSQIVDEIFRLNDIYHFQRFGVETTFFRGTLERDIALRQQDESNRAGYHQFSIEQFKTRWRSGEGKKQRIQSMQPFHERGDILFPGKDFETQKGHFASLADQMLKFTQTHMPEPNDVIDSLSWHIHLIQRGGEAKIESVPVNSPAWLEKQHVQEMNKKQRHLPLRMRRRFRTSLS